MTIDNDDVPQHIHHIHKGDTRVPLATTLKPLKSNSPVDLSGLTVEFYMIDDDGNEVIAQDSTGVAVDADPTTGKVTKTFLADDVANAGDFYGYFVVKNGTAEETFPVITANLLIRVHDD